MSCSDNITVTGYMSETGNLMIQLKMFESIGSMHFLNNCLIRRGRAELYNELFIDRPFFITISRNYIVVRQYMIRLKVTSWIRKTWLRIATRQRWRQRLWRNGWGNTFLSLLRQRSKYIVPFRGLPGGRHGRRRSSWNDVGGTTTSRLREPCGQAGADETAIIGPTTARQKGCRRGEAGDRGDRSQREDGIDRFSSVSRNVDRVGGGRVIQETLMRRSRGRVPRRGSPPLVMGSGGVNPGKFLNNLYVVHEF